MALNREKFQQAVLYFLHESNPQLMGRVKLMKLLYYLDFDHLERHRRSVTGDKYIHLEHGPVPKSSWDEIDKMNGTMLLVDHVDVGFSNPRHVLTPLVGYDLSVFTDTERDILIAVNREWKDATTPQIEFASHQETPWLSTKLKQEVPKVMAFRRRPSDPPTLELQEQMLQSVISSLSKEGVEVPEDEARAILANVTREFWNDCSLQACP